MSDIIIGMQGERLTSREQARVTGHPVLEQAPLREQIMEAALKDFPREACGFVLDTGAVVHCTNVDDAPYYRFRIDPDEAAHWWSTDRVVAVWHSHPDAPAVPSELDAEMAHEDLPFLIFSVPDEDLGWYVRDGGALRLLRMESPA